MKCNLSISVIDGKPCVAVFDGESLIWGDLKVDQLHDLIKQCKVSIEEMDKEVIRDANNPEVA